MMKFKISSAFALIPMLAIMVSCHDDDRERAEAKAKREVGNIYNHEVQGIEHENRENQFYTSRSDNRKGIGQETGAPSDTAGVAAPDVDMEYSQQ